MGCVSGRPLAPDQENRVTMMATGVIRGRVVDEAGQPIRNFRVLVNHPRNRKPDEIFCLSLFSGRGSIAGQ